MLFEKNGRCEQGPKLSLREDIMVKIQTNSLAQACRRRHLSDHSKNWRIQRTIFQSRRIMLIGKRLPLLRFRKDILLIPQ
jgi:hypothetical protein